MKPLFAGILCATLMAMLCAAPAALAQQKTIKECRAEWQANKAENQAKRITEAAYITQCRAGTSGAATPMAPGTTETSPATTPATAPRTSSAPTAANPTGANQFASESQ